MKVEQLARNGRPYLLITSGRAIDVTSTAGALGELFRMPLFNNGGPAIWDLREADLSTFSFEDMGRVVSKFGSLPGRQFARVAAVIREEDATHFGEKWDGLAGYAETQRRHFFHSLDDALDWVLEAGPSS